jgi:glucose-1-phosphate cytidylyltransferase
MKVVLFCGGLGTRIREYSEKVPKPMIPVGYRPILWHVMKYYAHFGHTDFILALGYKADVIKSFFLDYKEALSNDFTWFGGGREIQLASSDIDDWTITFVDTGIDSNVGERLLAVRGYLGADEMFLANYSDGLTDLDLNGHIERFQGSNAVATFLAVKPPLTYHTVEADPDGTVKQFLPISSADVWINGGYFVLRREIFDHMNPGEDLVLEPFQRLLKEQRLLAHRYSGFWAPMDTFKDKQRLEDLFATGRTPWGVWRSRNES